MKFLRVLFPFLFVRNWYDGAWELSHARLSLFLACMSLFAVAVAVVIVLQAPVEYTTRS